MDWEKDILPELLGSEGAIIEGATVYRSVLLDEKKIKAPWVVFKNVTFKETIVIEYLSHQATIAFYGCNLEAGVVFQYLSIKTKPSDKYSISFEECKINTTLFVRECILSNNIIIRNCTIAGAVTLTNVNLKTSQFWLANTKIGLDLEIHKCFINKFTISANSNIAYTVNITESSIGKLTTIDSVFKDNIVVEDCTVEEMYFSKGEYGNVYINDVKGQGSLSLQESNVKGDFLISYTDIQDYMGVVSVVISSCSFTNGFYMFDSNSFSLNAVLKKIYLFISDKSSGVISFSNLDVEEIRLSGINLKASIRFYGVNLNILEIDRFYNQGQLSLSSIGAINALAKASVAEIQKNRNLYIANSNLGRTQIYDVNFDLFSTVDIYDAILSDIVWGNVIWFNHAKFRISKKSYKILLPQENLPSLRAKREIYRQLKYASEKQGDRIQALEFQRWEMHYYKKYLWLALSWKNWKSLQDWFILWTSQTNNFGQSWMKPIGIGAVFAFVFYIPIALLNAKTLIPYTLSFSGRNIANTLTEIYEQRGIYFQLLNPTHSLSGLYGTTARNPSIILFDILHRIITSYFLFQIITAFRKYVRS